MVTGFLLLVGMLLASLPARADWTDVTAIVRAETDLATQIAEACNRHCRGNRREGKLRWIRVKPASDGLYQVLARADPMNHHNTGAILGIGGGVGYSHTVDVQALATLDPSSCVLRIDRIDVVNDRYGLSGLARREEGRQHTIAHCPLPIASASHDRH